MCKQILKPLTYLLIFCSLFISLAYAKDKIVLNTSQYVDIAGQQRMLSHQALVAYSQIGQVQSYGNPVDLKLRAIKQFEKNLVILSGNKKIQSLTIEFQKLWAEYKAIILQTPDKKHIPSLIGLNEQLLQMSNTIIAKLLEGTDSKINVVNIAGQQRMLSQRIALFMLLENWGLREKYNKQYTDSLSQFSTNLLYLKHHEKNTNKIKKKLKSVENDYKKLIVLINDKNQERDYSFTISRLTSQILRKSKRNTKLYVELEQ